MKEIYEESYNYSYLYPKILLINDSNKESINTKIADTNINTNVIIKNSDITIKELDLTIIDEDYKKNNATNDNEKHKNNKISTLVIAIIASDTLL